jgi:hypothetical protein
MDNKKQGEITKESRMSVSKRKGRVSLPQKQTLRDANALLHGKRDGKIVIENVNPKLTGGKHKVIDEKFDNSDRI